MTRSDGRPQLRLHDNDVILPFFVQSEESPNPAKKDQITNFQFSLRLNWFSATVKRHSLSLCVYEKLLTLHQIYCSLFENELTVQLPSKHSGEQQRV